MLEWDVMVRACFSGVMISLESTTSPPTWRWPDARDSA